MASAWNKIPNDVEIDDAIVAPRALADSRLSARVSFHQRGYAGRKSTLTVRDGDKVLASREITFASDDKIQTENLLFNAGSAGAKTLQFSIEPLRGEQNRANNSVTRLVNVESGKRRILYVEGEPRWEYKFIRRAEDDDRIVQVASMLRTTENKIYRQGIDDPQELAEGFPARGEDLFGFQGLIIGSVEAGYFTLPQQELIREFVDRRGGGVLFLGGRFGLADGGWAGSSLADLLPVILPTGKNTFHRDPATVELTQAGADSIITRLIDDPVKNIERWKKLPVPDGLPGTRHSQARRRRARGNERSRPQDALPRHGKLRTRPHRRGGQRRRVALADEPAAGRSHARYVLEATAALARHRFSGPGGRPPFPIKCSLTMAASIFPPTFATNRSSPRPTRASKRTSSGPAALPPRSKCRPFPMRPASSRPTWNAEKPGSYVTEVVAQRGDQEIGRDVLTFQRMDGVAENFHTEQNRELLEKLASQTGGRYWRPDELSKLPDEIPYSDAGITMRETKELWNMPAIFLLLILLRFSEWLLRRKWGVV